MCLSARVRARALPSHSQGCTMETALLRQPPPGPNPSQRRTSLQEGAAATPRVRRDRPAVRLGWSRVGGVLLARLRGCPEAGSQGEG